MLVLNGRLSQGVIFVILCVLFVLMKDEVHLTVIKGISIAIWPCAFNLV
jgi:hypothetical protein